MQQLFLLVSYFVMKIAFLLLYGELAICIISSICLTGCVLFQLLFYTPC